MAAKAKTKDFDFGSLPFMDAYTPDFGTMDPGIDLSGIGSDIAPLITGNDPNTDSMGNPTTGGDIPSFNTDPSGNPLSGSSPSMLNSLASLLTGHSGASGALGGLGALLPMLASIYGGVQSRNATQDATHQVQQSLADANTTITGLLGGAGSMYKPYQDAGTAALAKLSALPPSNIAGQFKPIGSGRGLSLAQIAKG